MAEAAHGGPERVTEFETQERDFFVFMRVMHASCSRAATKRVKTGCWNSAARPLRPGSARGVLHKRNAHGHCYSLHKSALSRSLTLCADSAKHVARRGPALPPVGRGRSLLLGAGGLDHAVRIRDVLRLLELASCGATAAGRVSSHGGHTTVSRRSPDGHTAAVRRPHGGFATHRLPSRCAPLSPP